MTSKMEISKEVVFHRLFPFDKLPVRFTSRPFLKGAACKRLRCGVEIQRLKAYKGYASGSSVTLLAFRCCEESPMWLPLPETVVLHARCRLHRRLAADRTSPSGRGWHTE